jgi:hypothetical protein
MADKRISALPGASTPLAGTEVLPIVQGGDTVKVSVANLTAGRAVAMAGGSFTDNITQSTAAKGVNFTANTPAAGMTSQLLNWYEEGNWTPTDVSGAGLTITVNYCSYVRIGKQVTINAFLTFPATANASNINIGGLPFTVAANNYAPGCMSTNSGVSTVAEFAATTKTFYVVDPTNTGIFRVNANLTGANIILSGTYFI